MHLETINAWLLLETAKLKMIPGIQTQLYDFPEHLKKNLQSLVHRSTGDSWLNETISCGM